MSNKTIKKKKKDIFFKSGYDLFSDKNPKESIRIQYSDMNKIKDTIKKLESLYKKDKYSHTRIVQVANVMNQRVKVQYGENTNKYKLTNKYFNFLKSRTKLKKESERKKLSF